MNCLEGTSTHFVTEMLRWHEAKQESLSLYHTTKWWLFHCFSWLAVSFVSSINMVACQMCFCAKQICLVCHFVHMCQRFFIPEGYKWKRVINMVFWEKIIVQMQTGLMSSISMLSQKLMFQWLALIFIFRINPSCCNIGFWLNIDAADHSRGFYNIMLHESFESYVTFEWVNVLETWLTEATQFFIIHMFIVFVKHIGL